MANIYILSIANNYYVDIAKSMIELGFNIKMMGVSQDPSYSSEYVDSFISEVNPDLVVAENFNQPEKLAQVLDADYSCFTPEFLSKISHYEKMFLMSTDRLSFFPLSHIERLRLFYKYVAHFYNLLKKNNIDAVVNFGIPHGLYAITVFGLAKAMGIKAIYFDCVYIAPSLALLETDIQLKRSYTPTELILGEKNSSDDREKVSEIIDDGIYKKLPIFVRSEQIIKKIPKRDNKLLVFGKKVLGLILHHPFSSFGEVAFFLDSPPRKKIKYIIPSIKYFYSLHKIIKFYDQSSIEELPSKIDIVMFLHFNPEASTMPVGGIFADQLLVLDLLLEALPEGVTLYVKEHPMMFEEKTVLYEHKHERSIEFYQKILSDSRVKLLSRTMDSNELIQRAGIVVSVCGSVTWEAMALGKPAINFGWAWFNGCESCYQVESVDSIKRAITCAYIKNKEDVLSDVEVFLSKLKKRAIYGASAHFVLPCVGSNYDYSKGVSNIANAIKEVVSC